ncbi:Uncharacterised protein [Mycobacterium tuberculosis]|nr:Uncharacterised protein [Mycobacterium tuberculosis]
MGIDPTHRVTVDAGTLTDDQRDGLACVTCRTNFAPGTRSIPVAVVDGDQVFACVGCVPPCSDCGTVQYEYTDLDNDTARMDCPRGHAFPTAEPFTDAGQKADAERRAEQDGPDVDDAHVVKLAENIIALSRRAPFYGDLAEQARHDGDEQAATVFDTARAALEAIGTGNGLAADLTASGAALRDAVTVLRAREAADVPPVVAERGEGVSGGFLIPPPADPVERAEWEAGVAAREVAGLSGFVGEDYPTGGRR